MSLIDVFEIFSQIICTFWLVAILLKILKWVSCLYR